MAQVCEGRFVCRNGTAYPAETDGDFRADSQTRIPRMPPGNRSCSDPKNPETGCVEKTRPAEVTLRARRLPVSAIGIRACSSLRICRSQLRWCWRRFQSIRRIRSSHRIRSRGRCRDRVRRRRRRSRVLRRGSRCTGRIRSIHSRTRRGLSVCRRRRRRLGQRAQGWSKEQQRLSWKFSVWNCLKRKGLRGSSSRLFKQLILP